MLAKSGLHVQHRIKKSLELIQERAFKIISPHLPYDDAIEQFNVPTVKSRLTALCSRFFKEMTNDNHKLNHLLPPVN